MSEGRGRACACGCEAPAARRAAEPLCAPFAQADGVSGDKPDTCAVIVAGGSGERFGDPRGKQFVDLCGLPVLCWSLAAFDRAPSVARTVVVCSPERFDEVRGVLDLVALQKPVTLAPSGVTRQESVFSGLSCVGRDLDFVAVHDAARPLVEPQMIERCIQTVREDPKLAGAILAARSVDTLKLVEGTTIVATPDRSFYWCAQTPQVFRTRTLVAAHKSAARDEWQGTDDASLVERHGGRVRVVECSRDNIKITLPEDLAMAQATLERRLIAAAEGPAGEE